MPAPLPIDTWDLELARKNLFKPVPTQSQTPVLLSKATAGQ